MTNGIRHPGSIGVGRRPDRSVRIPPGSFTQDPGMRARDEFTDVASRGYNENAKRVAERGGAREYATSVEEEGGKKRADEIRNLVLMTLVALTTYGGATGRLAHPEQITQHRTAQAQQFGRTARQHAGVLQRQQWQPHEGYGRLRGGVAPPLSGQPSVWSSQWRPGLYRSSGGMSVPEDVLRAIEAVSRQAFKGVITPEELRVALWEIERRATP